MEYIKWTKKIAIGVEEIDTQHREIIKAALDSES